MREIVDDKQYQAYFSSKFLKDVQEFDQNEIDSIKAAL